MLLAAFMLLTTSQAWADITAKPIPAASSKYVVFAWNDLGMHCLNPTYDTVVLLPPYNNLFVQVVQRGNPPKIVTSGIKVEYSINGNTYSYGKTDKYGAKFSQFWDNALDVFGVTLARNKGINLTDPNTHNGLTGSMLLKSGYYVANGIPVTPVNDKGVWSPYQVAKITVKNSAGTLLASTTTTIPTSDEINCGKCHGADPFNDILTKHDALHGTDLVHSKPVLCADCHGDPVLGQTGPGAVGIYLSAAVHGSHASRGATCYDCHPGATTKCNRSAKHTASDGNCTNCHGDMATVADSINNGSRIPWKGEPKCSECHTAVAGVDTGAALYRESKGHGNMMCAACHGSPHAMIPSTQSADNAQYVQYQTVAKSMGSCGVCHPKSRGDGSADFSGVHGSSNPEVRSACAVCHTAVSSTTSKWPHAYQWKAR